MNSKEGNIMYVFLNQMANSAAKESIIHLIIRFIRCVFK